MTALRGLAATLALASLVAACSTSEEAPLSLPSTDVTATPDAGAAGAPAVGDDAATATPTPEPPPTAASPEPSPSPAPSPSPTRVPAAAADARPDWFGQRMLEVTATGFPAPQETPDIYVDRRLVSPDHLPPPPTDAFVSDVQPLPPDIVEVSTWEEGCPTTLDELRYLTVSYWGFDELHHTGELIVHRDVADDMVWLFEQLHANRFPMEEVALLDDEDVQQFHRHGDDNITAAYQCRATTGSSKWSQHAFGLAIDINPFHNPYLKDTAEGRIVLPAYATAYLDRGRDVPGVINEGGLVVDLFDQIGWEWGGRWNSLKDWQHFSARGG